MRTLKLDTPNWDLVITSGGNISIVDSSEAIIQDVASAIKTFLGEVFYDTTLGIPYSSEYLGQRLVNGLLSADIESAALSVPGVVKASASLALGASRVLTGTVTVTDVYGRQNTITI